jgi:hypothetical protein
MSKPHIVLKIVILSGYFNLNDIRKIMTINKLCSKIETNCTINGKIFIHDIKWLLESKYAIRVKELDVRYCKSKKTRIFAFFKQSEIIEEMCDQCISLRNNKYCNYKSKLINLKKLNIPSKCFNNFSKVKLETLIVRNWNQMIDINIKQLTNAENIQLQINTHIYPHTIDNKLNHLISLTNVQSLDVSNTALTNVGLKYISTLKGLSTLNITNCNSIINNNIQYILELINLKNLLMSLCYWLSNEGMQYISFLTNLENLNISSCNKVTNVGIKLLSNLKNLQKLNIIGCNKNTIHKSITHLCNIPNLQYLSLNAPINKMDIIFLDLLYINSLRELTVLSIHEKDEYFKINNNCCGIKYPFGPFLHNINYSNTTHQTFEIVKTIYVRCCSKYYRLQ